MPFICGYLGPTIIRNQNAGEMQTEKKTKLYLLSKHLSVVVLGNIDLSFSPHKAVSIPWLKQKKITI